VNSDELVPPGSCIGTSFRDPFGGHLCVFETDYRPSTSRRRPSTGFDESGSRRVGIGLVAEVSWHVARYRAVRVMQPRPDERFDVQVAHAAGQFE
jgi:hypothetical protein